jgi:hypothetical protein
MPDENQPNLIETEAFQQMQIDFLSKGLIDEMIEECYTEDARMHGFTFKAEGRNEVKKFVHLYLKRLSVLGERSIDKLITGQSFIWLEVTIQSMYGEPVKVYEVKFLREGKIYLQLLGLRQGTIWYEEDFLDFKPSDNTKAIEFHEHYLTFHKENNANGLADEFFSEDIHLLTSNVNIKGREAVREMFQNLFAVESGFTPLSVQNITNDTDYVWFEATVKSSLGERRVYDVMLLNEGKVCVQLVGQLLGVLPTEVAFNNHPN